MPVAALAMYDLPEIRPATDAWWEGLARHLRAAGLNDVPDRLDRSRTADDVCADPGLVLTQTCGYPLTHALSDRVRVIGAPSYDAPGCSGALYRSLLVVAENNPAVGLEDLRGGRAAVNNFTSHSGFNAFRAAIAALAEDGRFFSNVILSGGHRPSIDLVGRGEADVCTVDCVTHALIAAHAPSELAGTRVLGETEAAPGLPYVTAAVASDDDHRRLTDGVLAAAADPVLGGVRAELLIDGFEVLSRSAYGVIVEMERRAAELGAADVLNTSENED